MFNLCEDFNSIFLQKTMAEEVSISGKNLRIQSFPFRPKFMAYLIENADSDVVQKFHRCCKHLYKEAPYFIVDSIEMDDARRRFENHKYDICLDFMDNNAEFQQFHPKIRNIWVTKKIRFEERGEELLPKIVRCDASEVSILEINLPLKVLKVLTKSGNVETFEWHSVYLRDGRTSIPLERILAHVPNASSIVNDSGHCPTTWNTMKKILKIPFTKKIKKFYLQNVYDSLELGLFYEFVKVSFEFFPLSWITTFSLYNFTLG